MTDRLEEIEARWRQVSEQEPILYSDFCEDVFWLLTQLREAREKLSAAELGGQVLQEWYDQSRARVETLQAQNEALREALGTIDVYTAGAYCNKCKFVNEKTRRALAAEGGEKKGEHHE